MTPPPRPPINTDTNAVALAQTGGSAETGPRAPRGAGSVGCSSTPVTLSPVVRPAARPKLKAATVGAETSTVSIGEHTPHERADDDGWGEAGLVPPRRLGALLSEARSARGLTLEDVAGRSAGTFGLARLASVERGTVRVSDDEIARLAAMYGLAATRIVPARSKLIVDLDEGLLTVDGRNEATVEVPGREEVLTRYLAMVHSMRQIPPGTPVPLRLDDLDVLGRALHTGADQLRADLEALMEDSDHTVGARFGGLKAKVLLPAAGILVAFCGVGALVLVQGAAAQQSPSRQTPTVQVAPTAPTEVGTAVVQERNADGTPGPVVERTGP